MPTKTLDQHIAVTPGVCGGKPRLAGHRIKVQDVAIWRYQAGMTVEQIAQEYELPLADVYAALAYYHDHREQIDRDIADDEAFVEGYLRDHPSSDGPRLRDMLDAQGS